MPGRDVAHQPSWHDVQIDAEEQWQMRKLLSIDPLHVRPDRLLLVWIKLGFSGGDGRVHLWITERDIVCTTKIVRHRGNPVATQIVAWRSSGNANRGVHRHAQIATVLHRIPE